MELSKRGDGWELDFLPLWLEVEVLCSTCGLATGQPSFLACSPVSHSAAVVPSTVGSFPIRRRAASGIPSLQNKKI